ncbi:MAG: hypothetical protein HN729_05710 [Candidatus Marinimicrobia bacterium]|jgi:hypothetical protein|nr:hypothetical protein [Candidatus Neomarinimicrobiota bacterium]MBT3634328.1 hypothetical protein [Candidatus Neomarinimicrobiota bacterium]MBT3681763.1 hypothetical protein [Candidatus Neomarinimicrobiota bacterium]MBT3759489.1 hypothetical protein [Candidatus Neomarinimicrobiota bacterium]MBT3895977.1 hypothetical protein [Candidatus Neomarinimicrobiota bacterium]
MKLKNYLLKSLFIFFLIIIYNNCEKIPAVQNEKPLSLIFTCENCHTNELVLKQLAKVEEPTASGGG